ncbi:MAG: diacylglycerol kinase family lipid kinase [Deltaproteobacteria bacterium]|nr:diacylglycerol kinase family lipid kinase [Deltaproteobacteria bacterium]
MKTLVVINPHSANRRTGQEWSSIRTALQNTLDEFDERFTTASGDATQIVREGLLAGTERIIAVGGDGTYNEVVNGFFEEEEPINPEALLGIVPRGTGGDLRKTLGIGRKLVDCLPVLRSGHFRTVDVGRASFLDGAGRPCRRHFINITSFGIGGLVDEMVNRSSKALGGKASFFLGTARAMLLYRNQTIRLKVDDHFDETLCINNVAVANGQYHGGGMWVAPGAEIDDGLFDVVILGDFSKLEMLTQGLRIYQGTHLDLPKVRSLRGLHVEASSDAEVLIDMDGEQPGKLPISLDVLPKALRLIAP